MFQQEDYKNFWIINRVCSESLYMSLEPVYEVLKNTAKLVKEPSSSNGFQTASHPDYERG
ncbi:hypothetical protein CS542_02230 [Pedobacter sp. IW39]|nr:hypothetical protein CS542_02230 [Pedobacter sp. IW39]